MFALFYLRNKTERAETNAKKLNNICVRPEMCNQRSLSPKLSQIYEKKQRVRREREKQRKKEGLDERDKRTEQ